MANFYLPYINPIKYHQIDFENIPQYVSKHMDDFSFTDTILPWQQQKEFYQSWQLSDTISQQVTSNAGATTIQILDEFAQVVTTDSFTQVRQNFYVTDTFIQEHNLALNVFEGGVYFIKLTAGDLVLISEPQIFKEKIEDSLLVQYKNNRYFSGVIFDTGFYPSIRIPGVLLYEKPGAKKTIYEDQILNNTVLDSKHFDVWKLYIGTSEGVPDYLIKMLNPIIGCSTLSIDGRLYTAAEGAQFEKSEEEGYPMKGWTIELRDKLNRGAHVYEDVSLMPAGSFIMSVIDTEGFSTNPGDGSTHIVIDTN